MSVTNIILTAPRLPGLPGPNVDQADALTAINGWLRGNGHQPLLDVSDIHAEARAFLGPRVEATVLLGACAKLNQGELLEVVRDAAWGDGGMGVEHVRVFMQDEHEHCFRQVLPPAHKDE